MQNKLDKLLVRLLSDPIDKGLSGEGCAHTVGRESVFWEAVIEEGGYVDGGGAELFLLLCEVGAADVADGDFVAELREEGEHFGGGGLGGGLRCQWRSGGWLGQWQTYESSRGKSVVDIEEDYRVLDGTRLQRRDDSCCLGCHVGW